MKRMTRWDKVAEKEGRIYCQKQDSWCAFTNMKDGSCLRDKCVNKKDGDVNGGKTNVRQDDNR